MEYVPSGMHIWLDWVTIPSSVKSLYGHRPIYRCYMILYTLYIKGDESRRFQYPSCSELSSFQRYSRIRVAIFAFFFPIIMFPFIFLLLLLCFHPVQKMCVLQVLFRCHSKYMYTQCIYNILQNMYCKIYVYIYIIIYKYRHTGYACPEELSLCI